MEGFLKTKTATSSANDVHLRFADSVIIAPNKELTAFIAESNAGYRDHAYLMPHYALIEVNGEEFGVEIISPESDLPKSLIVGAQITIRLHSL